MIIKTYVKFSMASGSALDVLVRICCILSVYICQSARGITVIASKKILVMGLPGAGKTTLAGALLPRLNAVHFNADLVRANVHKDLGFTLEDRIEHARRLGWLCDQVARQGPMSSLISFAPRKRRGLHSAQRSSFGLIASRRGDLKIPTHCSNHPVAVTFESRLRMVLQNSGR